MTDHDAWVPPTETATPVLVWATAAWMAALAGWAAGSDATGRGFRIAGGVLVVLLVGMAVVGRRRRRRGPSDRASRGRRVGRTLLGTVLVVGVVGGSAIVRAQALDTGPLAEVARRGGEVEVSATVASEPVHRPDGTAWALVSVTRVDGRAGRWRALVGRLKDPPPVGARVEARTTARPLGHDGFEGSLRRRHAGVRLDPVTWRTVAPPGGLLARVERVRANVRVAAGRGLGGDAGALAVGLVTGDTRGLSEDTADDMRATGLTHLVAVSGSNVALVLAVVAALAGGLPVGWRRVAMLAAVVVFTVTTRVEPSVLRAAVMAGVVLAARVRGVVTSAVHALAATVLVLLVIDPAAAGSLGLVLSALATGGVLVVAPVLVARLPTWLPRPIRMLVAASVGAQVAVAPVLLATIGEVPLVSVPANLVAVPAAAVASLVAVVAAVVAQVHVGLAGVLFTTARPALAIVLGVAGHASGPVLSPSRPAVLVLAGALVVVGLARTASRTRRAAVATALVVTVGTALGPGVSSLPWAGDRPPLGVLSVTSIDVGQGDAVLVTTASGHRLLVDAGGDDRAATWLRRHGIEWLDVVVVSHAHADHVGGLDDLLGAVDVGTIWHAPGPDEPAGLPARVPTADGPVEVPAVAARVVDVRAGTTARLGSARVEVLGPPDGWALVGTEGGRNDRSVVLRVREGRRVALLTGDAEVAAQAWLLDHVPDLRASLLKVPHHGGATTDADFLRAVSPAVAVVSVGRDNDYGHPSPEVLGELADLGAVVHRTDHDGTVTVVVPAVPP